MDSPDKNDRYEIILSKITSDLTAYSSSGLIRRGNELADIILHENSPLNRVEEILFSLWASKSTPIFRAEIASTLLELGKSANSIAEEGIKLLNSEFASDDNLPHAQKRDLLQILARVGYDDYSAEYVLNLIRSAPIDNSQNTRTFNHIAYLKWYAQIFNHLQSKHIVKLIDLMKSLSHPEIYIAIETLGSLNCKSPEMIRFLEDIAQSKDKFLAIRACEVLIRKGEVEIAHAELERIAKIKGHDEDAIIVLGLLGKVGVAAQILLDKFQKDSFIFPTQVFKYLKYLAEFGKRKESIAILLKFLNSLNSGKSDIRVLKNVIEPHKKTLDALLDLNYKDEYFVHSLLVLAANESADSVFRINALNALSRLNSINANGLEKIVLIASTPKQHKIDISMFAAGTLCNFMSSRQIGAELLVQLWKNYPLATTYARSAFENIEKCGNDPKTIAMLIEMALTPKLGTPLIIDACRAIIHIKKKD